MRKTVVILISIAVLGCSCRYSNGRRVRGSGRVVTEQRNLSGFTGVDTQGSIDLVVSKGDYKVSVKGNENLMQYVVTETENGKLLVHFKSNMSFIDVDELTVYVSAPDINAFESHGSGNINGEGRLSDKERMAIKVFGSGDIKLDLDAPDIETEIHGSGNATLSGETRNLSFSIHGSGDINAAELKAENAKVSIHGSGDADIYASETIDAEITASGDIRYRGQPKITSAIHGSGEVSRMD